MSARRTSDGGVPGSAEEAVSGKNVLLIVTGGVAAYKAAALARLFVKAGAVVRTALTEGAEHFITPLTFEALTGERAVTSIWVRGAPEVEHVTWSEWADLAVIAPATANFMAKAAAGQAGSFALAALLAYPKAALFAPAMNDRMYQNSFTRRNIALLKEAGHRVLLPGTGALACGWTGRGRMPEPSEIFFEAARMLAPEGLKGRKILITGGSTVEPWDSVRFLSNRSTGLMGIELAQAAWLMGAEPTLILGAGALSPRIEAPDFAVSRVGSTQDMLKAVTDALPGKDALFMAAAPADFRPERAVEGKIKKSEGPDSIPLVRNPDILKSLTANKLPGTLYVGFNADEEDTLLERAREKLLDKNLDFIIANPATGPQSSFAVAETSFHILKKGGETVCSGRASKFAAAWIMLRTVFGLDESV